MCACACACVCVCVCWGMGVMGGKVFSGCEGVCSENGGGALEGVKRFRVKRLWLMLNIISLDFLRKQ